MIVSMLEVGETWSIGCVDRDKERAHMVYVIMWV